MLKIKVTGLKEMQAEVNDLIKHRIPKMTAIALTQTAKSLEGALRTEMRSRFDRPTPWALNGLFTKSATPSDLNAHVWFKDDRAVGTGTPAVKFMWSEVHGGPRSLKRYEKALQRFGVLPGGYYTVPGKGLKLDRFGNIPTGKITEILTGVRALQGMSDTTFGGVMGGFKLRKKTTANFFVVKVRQGGLEPGIWERVPEGSASYQGGQAMQKGKARGEHYYKGVGRVGSNLIMARGVRPILMFVKAPRYTQRLPFYDISQKHVDIEFPKIWGRLADETLAFHQARRKG